jgi:hypothetical protein
MYEDPSLGPKVGSEPGMGNVNVGSRFSVHLLLGMGISVGFQSYRLIEVGDWFEIAANLYFNDVT